MPSPFSQKTVERRPRDERRRNGRNGAVSLVVIFLFFVFSGLGLSVIFLTQIHLKLNALRKFSTVLDCASENGIKRGFHNLMELLRSSPSLAEISEDRMAALTADPEAGFRLILEDTLGVVFPRSLEETWENENWGSLTTCALDGIENRGLYCRITADIRIESEGMMKEMKPRRISVMETSLSFLAGRLPLASLPLFIDEEMEEGSREKFLEDNNISILRRSADVIGSHWMTKGGEVIPKDAVPLIAKALKIQIFYPQDLSADTLRSILGLELSAEPIPDGVYLIRDDLGLGGIFVQGDVDEMITAVEGDFQVIAFRMADGDWILKFNPALGRAEFQTPAEEVAYDLVPLGIIIVNGGIHSLGGGVVNANGEIEPVADGETPSILSGVSLTIVASEKITLTTHLILQNVRWQEGIPSIKDSKSQLILFSTGRDAVSGEDREGGITVGSEAPAHMKIQASLTASDGGFEISGHGKDVELLGGLQTVDYAGNGNSLRILPDERIANGILPEDTPHTPNPRLAIVSLKVLSWKEY